MPDQKPRRRPATANEPHREMTIAEVHIEEFREAQRDPRVAKFLAEAKAEGAKLKRAGLIHYETG